MPQKQSKLKFGHPLQIFKYKSSKNLKIVLSGLRLLKPTAIHLWLDRVAERGYG